MYALYHQPFFYPFICTSILSSTHSFNHPLMHSFFHPSIYLFMCSPVGAAAAQHLFFPSPLSIIDEHLHLYGFHVYQVFCVSDSHVYKRDFTTWQCAAV